VGAAGSTPLSTVTRVNAGLLLPGVLACAVSQELALSAVDTLELEVRDLVRRRGINPYADQLEVRRLVDEVVDEVVADYDERSLSSALPQLADVRQAAGGVYDAVAGLRPLQSQLYDPTVQEIWVNERSTGLRLVA